MFIYKITNTQNNKVYIGQTIRPVEERWRRHKTDALNNVLDTHFARAIRKYGKDSFINMLDNPQSSLEFLMEQHKLNKNLTDIEDITKYINESLNDLLFIDSWDGFIGTMGVSRKKGSNSTVANHPCDYTSGGGEFWAAANKN